MGEVGQGDLGVHKGDYRVLVHVETRRVSTASVPYGQEGEAPESGV